MSEHPVSLKSPKRRHIKRKTQTEKRYCIIHYSKNKTDIQLRTISNNTFDRIQTCKTLRQNTDDQDIRLDDICKQCPDTYDNTIHGYHRWCYQNFTNVHRLRKRKHDEDKTDEKPCSSSKRSRTGESSFLFPADKCILCGKYRRQVHGKREKPIKCVTITAEESIKEAAARKDDKTILREICNKSLVAGEAHYHSSCRNEYTRSHAKHTHGDDNTSETTTAQNEAHKMAFEHICQHVENSIIKGANVERMTMLKEKYLSYMQENNPEQYNPNYKTYKLKDKLMRHFGHRIKFWTPNYRSDLVYSNDIPVGQAVETAFEHAASDERIIEECAMLVRRCINDSKTDATDLPWPPQSLLGAVTTLPALLQLFLSVLISEKPLATSSRRTQRLVESYSQDLCFAVTNGQWKTPKHLLLGMTLRHLTGSAEIITLVNHFGHCQSYSQILELETAMCNSTVGRDTCLPATISADDNVITHLCWDNFDLNEETPSGAGTTHTAHGIVIQETTTDASERTGSVITPEVCRLKARSVKYQPEELEPCYLKEKCEPDLTVDSITVPQSEVTEHANESDFFWIVSRRNHKESQQCVPGWSGWVSLTAKDGQEKQSTVDYMPPINAPMTENATVQKVMQTSKKVAEEVGQKYTLVTFDLAVAKKAYAMLWQSPEVYKDTIVQLGAFHTIASYLGALGKRLRGSGFAEVVIEAGICASGSIEKVLSGKHYNRAMRVHKLVMETLERLLLDKFHSTVVMEDDVPDEDGNRVIEELAVEPSSERLNRVLANGSCVEFYQKYQEFKKSVRNGQLGKTAEYWIDYMDKVWLVLQFLRATKENDLNLHMSCLEAMCPLLFAYDHHNYARYVPVYLLSLINMEKTHPGAEALLRNNGFSVSRSNVPASRNAVDITIEQTINRHAKSRGGIVGFSRNISAYYRWCITRHKSASYVQATFELADMSASETVHHKGTRVSELSRSECEVAKVQEAFNNFFNPFDMENKQRLFCIASGSPATAEIERDLLRANDIGHRAFTNFVKERLVDKEVSFHAPLKRQKLRTFDAMKKTSKLSSTKNKLVEVKAQRNMFGQLVLLSEENNISLDKALSYQLGPVPWTLATADGWPMKTDKAKLLHNVEKETAVFEKPSISDSMYIIDGNASLQAMTWLPETFEELAEKTFGMLPKTERVDFITDTYKDISIKGCERERRGVTETFLVKGSKTKVPRDWKAFMLNSKNKKQLIRLLLTEWVKDKYAEKLKGRRILFAYEEECTCISSLDGVTVSTSPVTELFTSQEEADTRIILHLMHAAKETTTDMRLIVRSPDTDVYMLLLTFVQNIEQSVLFETGSGNKRRLLNIKMAIEKEGDEKSKALLGLHCFTGCDTTSAFVRQGKIKPKKVLEKYPEFIPIFARLGEDTQVDDDISTELEKFVCCMYGKATYTDVDKLRVDLFRQKFQPKSGEPLSAIDGIDLSMLPPCKSSLSMHIKRVNYQTLIWKASPQQHPDIPSPDGHGWTIDECEHLEYNLSDSPILPPEMVDILAQHSSSVDDDSELEDDRDDDVEFDNYIDIIFDDEVDETV